MSTPRDDRGDSERRRRRGTSSPTAQLLICGSVHCARDAVGTTRPDAPSQPEISIRDRRAANPSPWSVCDGTLSPETACSVNSSLKPEVFGDARRREAKRGAVVAEGRGSHVRAVTRMTGA